MAVLKDLIVHGPSKFIGKTQFNTINARSIGAKEGIFEKLIATTLNAETATIDDLTAQNATVVGLLDVQGELHTNAWTNANIANIGGSFYISPSVEAVSGTITINKNTSNWTVQITGNFATDFIKTAGATTASAWPVDSLVLVTGNIVVNNMDYPLGTLKGKLTAQVAASAATTSKTITMTCASTYVDNPNADVLQMLYEANGNANITNAAFSNGKISMYKISGTKPIGILLSSVGITAKGSNYIDIYGGTNNDGTPNLRIGHLTGLPAISLNGRSMTPTGWGLYADNAYLSGTIHSAAGIIGGFTIDSNSLHNGTFGTANSVLVSTGTSSAANIAGSGSISGWAFTAGTTYGVTKTGALYATSGSIAGWNFNGTSLYKNSATPGASTSAMVISTGTASTNNIGGGGTASKTWMLSAGTGFGVTTSGILYATGAHINGAITATSGTIGGFHISNSANTGTSANGGHFYTTSLYAQSGDGTYEYEVGMKGDGNSTTDQSGNLAFYVKRMTKGASWSSATNIFYITKGGTLYAQSADITGKITANSGYIGGTSGWTIASQQLYNGTIGADNSLHLGTKNLGSNTFIAGRSGSDWRLTVGSKFGVTNTGVVYASGATITGAITATSLSLGTNVSIAAGKVTGLSTVATSGKYSDLSGTPNLTVYIAKDGTIGSTPASGANGFKVSSAGVLTASNAIIYGTIYATAGTIGGCSISSGVLKVKEANIDGKLTASVLNVSTLSAITANMGTLTAGIITTNSSRTTYNAATSGLTLTMSGIGAGNGSTNTFYVNTSGTLYASNATITGTINANSGYFKNIQIRNSNNANILQIVNNQLTLYYNSSGTTVQKAMDIGSNGIILYKNSSKRAAVTADGLDIFGSDGATSVASFGETVRVGAESGFKTLVSAGGISLTDETGSNAFEIVQSDQTLSKNSSTLYSLPNAGAVNFSADITNCTISFKLQRVTNQQASIVASTTKTNSSLAVGSSFTLGTSATQCTITRTAANSFRAISTSGAAGLILKVSWTKTASEVAMINFTGANKMLWSGAMYMKADQTATLSEPVSSQLTGIVLVWSAYADGEAKDYHWHFTFVPKNFVLLLGSTGLGVSTGLMTGPATLSNVGTKYVYVGDESISGNANNTATGTSKGITYANNHWVLRYVWGV